MTRLLFLMNEALFFTTHRMPIALAAREEGFEVHVAGPPDPRSVRAIEAEGLTFHEIPLSRGSRNVFVELRLIASMYRLIRALRPDLLHCVTMKPILYGGALARVLRLPAVVHSVTGLGHLFVEVGLGAALMRSFVFGLYRFALGYRNMRAIFQNPDDLEMFIARSAVRWEKANLIKGTGVDLDIFRPREDEASDPPVVMYTSRIIGAKGARVFVEAARMLKEQGISARFVLVGRTDPQAASFISEEEIGAWQAQGMVEWWGFHTDMPETLIKAAIVCLPSYYREGVPRALIEAAACGLPLVTADMPGCREIVHDGENGFLVPPRDTSATASALRRLIEDRELRHRMGARSRAIAEADYALDQFVARHLAVYRAVLGAGAAV